MKSIGFKESLPIKEQHSFIEFERDIPKPTGYDQLVKIEATSVNPVDFKIRQTAAKNTILDIPKSLVGMLLVL